MSEKRQRTETVAIRLLPGEKVELDEAALGFAVPVGTFVRAAAMASARLLASDSRRLMNVREQENDERNDG